MKYLKLLKKDEPATLLFKVKVARTQERTWQATVVHVPSCVAWGGTRDVALRNVQDRLEYLVRISPRATLRNFAERIVRGSIIVAVTTFPRRRATVRKD